MFENVISIVVNKVPGAWLRPASAIILRISQKTDNRY